MKIAYIDAQFGASGNMLLGALINAGVPIAYLEKELKKIALPHALHHKEPYQIKKSTVVRSAIACELIEVKVNQLHHEHEHRTQKDIQEIIARSKLSPKIKKQAMAIFKNLIAAEARVHGKPTAQVYLHDVGAIDAIVDIVGMLICLDYLNVERVYVSELPLTQGRIHYHHGILSLPAPATAEVFKTSTKTGIKLQSNTIHGELVTPTGASIIGTLSEPFENLPRLEIEKIGYGAGSKEFRDKGKLHPNYLRIFIAQAHFGYEKDAILQIESNIDDLDPKKYDGVIKRLMAAGALDAAVVPIRMKKQRDAQQLQVMCRPEDKDKILDLIYSLTTAIGTRVYLVQREKLAREIVKSKTGARNKIAYTYSSSGIRLVKNVKPE